MNGVWAVRDICSDNNGYNRRKTTRQSSACVRACVRYRARSQKRQVLSRERSYASERRECGESAASAVARTAVTSVSSARRHLASPPRSPEDDTVAGDNGRRRPRVSRAIQRSRTLSRGGQGRRPSTLGRKNDSSRIRDSGFRDHHGGPPAAPAEAQER